jgi:hypothetical protein
VTKSKEIPAKKPFVVIMYTIIETKKAGITCNIFLLIAEKIIAIITNKNNTIKLNN